MSIAFNPSLPAETTGKTRININESQAAEKFSWDLINRLYRSDRYQERTKVLLCIGTDRSTGDCLGPLIGSKLCELNQSFFKIYGTLDDPVHATNLESKLEEINTLYANPIIIAIDACLGNLNNVGCVNISNGALQPGAGVNKSLPAVGDINITGVVNVGGFMEYLVLQNTRLNLVMRMANLVTEGLIKSTVDTIPAEI